MDAEPLFIAGIILWVILGTIFNRMDEKERKDDLDR